MKKRILVCMFHQESNTFNPLVWDLSRFGPKGHLDGAERMQTFMSGNSIIKGGVDILEEAGYEAVPTTFLYATSGGRVADEVLDYLNERMAYYTETEAFDGVFAYLHGATCSVSEDDACGAFLEKLRSLVGNKPIAVACDLHAKITPRMLRNADAICGYQTYPHIDLYSTGHRAAAQLLALLEGKKLRMVTVDLPIFVPPAGYTTMEQPFQGLMEKALAMVSGGKLSDVSIFPVQPWLDIPEITSRIVAISEDTEIASQCALELARDFYAIKDDMWPKLYSIDAVIDAAEANDTDKPVLLVDAADSPNGGAVGDSHAVALRLMERGSKLKAGMFIVDPAAVELAFATGVGNKAQFSIGAAYTKGMPGPLKTEALVRSLHDGWFPQEAKARRGTMAYLGKTAVVTIGNISIVLCHRGGASGDPQILRHFGVDPSLQDLVVVKANTSFREPYSLISDLVYFADTPGAGSSNLKAMLFENLPQGLYPFASITCPEEVEIW